jgi:hypothetical protein
LIPIIDVIRFLGLICLTDLPFGRVDADDALLSHGAAGRSLLQTKKGKYVGTRLLHPPYSLADITDFSIPLSFSQIAR